MTSRIPRIPLHTPIPPEVLDQAVDWLMRFQAAEMGALEKKDFEHWLHADALHLAAWERAEKVMHTFNDAPSVVARHTLSRLSPSSKTKNRALRLLGVTAAMTPILNFLLRGDIGDI